MPTLNCVVPPKAGESRTPAAFRPCRLYLYVSRPVSFLSIDWRWSRLPRSLARALLSLLSACFMLAYSACCLCGAAAAGEERGDNAFTTSKRASCAGLVARWVGLFMGFARAGIRSERSGDPSISPLPTTSASLSGATDRSRIRFLPGSPRMSCHNERTVS